MTKDAFSASRWESVDPETFTFLWDAESEALPSVSVETLVLLTGLLQPFRTSIPSDNERIWRVEPEGRGSLTGRAITTDQTLVLKGRFRGTAPETADELVATVLAGEGTAHLGRGLTLRTRRVAGTRRLELDGVPARRAAEPEGRRLLHRVHRPPVPRLRAGRRGHRANPYRERGLRRRLSWLA